MSVAYKTVSGGESAKRVQAPDFTNNSSYYGFFAPPGLDSMGQVGLSLFANATLPFLTAASRGVDPSISQRAKTYGFNLLLLNSEDTAMLDIPQPAYISAVQTSLARGESWRVTADVIGTVARYDRSKETNPRAFSSVVRNLCTYGGGEFFLDTMYNGWAVGQAHGISQNNQSFLMALGFLPVSVGGAWDQGCSNLPA